MKHLLEVGVGGFVAGVVVGRLFLVKAVSVLEADKVALLAALKAKL